MKKITLLLLLILTLSACKQKETDKFAPYYGDPQSAQMIVDGKTYDSKIGSSTWVYIDADGKPYGELGDAPAIITPAKPILAKSPLSLTLKLPVPIDPTDLWYSLVDVTDKSPYPSWRVGFWHELPIKEKTSLPLLYEQELDFTPVKSGDYVLVVHATWEGSPITVLEAYYGFLFTVQE